jgi:hypothetical protein
LVAVRGYARWGDAENLEFVVWMDLDSLIELAFDRTPTPAEVEEVAS